MPLKRYDRVPIRITVSHSACGQTVKVWLQDFIIGVTPYLVNPIDVSEILANHECPSSSESTESSQDSG